MLVFVSLYNTYGSPDRRGYGRGSVKRGLRTKEGSVGERAVFRLVESARNADGDPSP